MLKLTSQEEGQEEKMHRMDRKDRRNHKIKHGEGDSIKKKERKEALIILKLL